MKLEWMGAYRDIVGDFYRSANGYSQICKTELFGDKIRFSPYEVQIMEHILEYAEQHKNMKWYAERLGLSQATLSKYVRKLVDKGLLEKYHREGNRKDIILMVSPLGLEEYERYSQQMKAAIFDELFHLLDSISPEELEIVKKVFAIYGHWHRESLKSPKDRPVSLIKVEGR
ncbi:MAG: MarR family transcriptional regulator [Oscillospiraceae bacterium]|nr:MarR family transcriptional regulator [Oscillospiraceae bacterium]MDE7004474.1 MarR family transcriptional regulator [Oscillospiraceae bacterium]